MKINVEYEDGRVKVEGTPTEEEKDLYRDIKFAAGKFYENVESILESTMKVEGVLTEEKEKVYESLKTAAGEFDKTVKELLEGRVFEGTLEIKVKKRKD